MYKSAKSRAEEKFAASQKKSKKYLKEKEQARQERAEKMARLRALRLANESAHRETAKTPDSKAPSTTSHDLSGFEPRGANEKDGKEDLLKIPSFLRRQAN